MNSLNKKYDILRISSHGEFVDTVLYDESKASQNYTQNPVKFNIWFRGEIGHVVLTRCNTRTTMNIDGKTHCSSFIGRRDFHKNMTINYGINGIQSAIVMGCPTKFIPDMKLSFDDGDFPSGFSVYDKNGRPLRCNGQFIYLNKFKIDGIERDEILLSELLHLVYINIPNYEYIKNKVIDIYISSCLYIEPSSIQNIITNYQEWYDCNHDNILIGYQKELDSNNKSITNDSIKLESLFSYTEYLRRMNNKDKLNYYIDIILNREPGFDNYIYKYLTTDRGEILDIDQIIDQLADRDDYDKDTFTSDQSIQYSNNLSREVEEILSKKITDKEQRIRTQQHINSNKKEMGELTNKKNILEKENLEINKAIDIVNKTKVQKKRNINLWDESDTEKDISKKRRIKGGKKKNLTKKNHREIYYINGYDEGQEWLEKVAIGDQYFPEDREPMRGGTGSDSPLEYKDNLEMIKDDDDAFNSFMKNISKDNGKYTIGSCKRLKNLTESKQRLLFDPLVKSHIKNCAKFNVISNFFNSVNNENRTKEGYLFRYIINKLDLKMKEANDDGIDTINNHSISEIILTSDYYSEFTIDERVTLFTSIRNFIISTNLHLEKYSKILFILLSTYHTRGENQFRIRIMDLLKNLAYNLREINTNEETIDRMIIKFIKSLSWKSIIEY